MWTCCQLTLIYSLSKSTIKFTRLTPGNVCVQAEGMLKPMKTLVLIQHHVERMLQKNKIVILNCQLLILGENYTEIKAQLKSP